MEVFEVGKPQEVADLIVGGLSPREIYEQLGISFGSVNQYFYRAIGAGLIRRSDVLFNIPSQEREAFEQLISAAKSVDTDAIYRQASKRGWRLDTYHLELYLELRDVRISMGDMYEFLLSIEVTLHDAIKAVLRAEYGDPEWWRKGVPERVRVECAQLLEQDPDPASEPYCYTSFIHLREILDKQWALFSSCLPPVAAQDKKAFLDKLVRLNGIRNRVMHPVKGAPPTEDDFQFVREFHLLMKPANWRRCPDLSHNTQQPQNRP